MDLGLAGRVYVLTGATRGLGYATAQALLADGAHVIVTGRDADRAAAAAGALNAEHPAGPGSATAIAMDNADPDAAARLVDAAYDAHHRLDGGLVSVGGPPRGTAAGVSDDAWRSSFETVFLGTVRLARTLTARLEPGGAVAFVLSSSVRVPIPGLGISNGLRPGLAGVAKDMADEYGPRGVRVLSLLPGSIHTDRLREIYDASPDPVAAAAAAAGAIPLRRLGDPAEFGRVAAFLLSPAASYLTGVAIPIDGGATRII